MKRRLGPLSMLGILGIVPGIHAQGLPCSDKLAPHIPGAQLLSMTAIERVDQSVLLSNGTPAPNFCEVSITLTHPGEGDKVNIQIMLPLENWNGRFQSLGGGGFAMRIGDSALQDAMALGYSTAQTDGGLNLHPFAVDEWALNEKGAVNQSLLMNFASRSLHDMAVAGKAVSTAFYGGAPKYSYWSGCSTGGRQGYMLAQKYPEDFDGILANAPAINWNRFIPAEFWPQLIMNQENVFPTECELGFIRDTIIRSCDALDGVEDGIIENQTGCKFDPYSLVGLEASCDGVNSVITPPMATLIEKIHQGARTTDGKFLWYGLQWGARYGGLASSKVVDGKLVGAPFAACDQWIRFFLKQNPAFDVASMTHQEYESLFALSIALYGDIMETGNPDLSKFFRRGGKLLTWHGVEDAVIFPQGTIEYYNRVKDTLGADQVDGFYRFFLAPGVGHCRGGNGPFPADPLGQLVAWVEKGQAPDTLLAKTEVDGKVISRNLCQYPLVSSYTGHGDPNLAESYVCATHFRKTESTKEGTKDEL